MKICVLATSYPKFAGDHNSVFVHGLAKGLRQAGHQVLALVPHEKGLALRDEIEGVHIERFRYFFPERFEQVAYGFGIPDNVRRKFWAKIALPFFVFCFFLKALRVSRDVDVIHVHWEISAFVALLIKVFTRRKQPIVFTVHRLVARKPLSRWLSAWLLRSVDDLHFNSTFTYNEAKKIIPRLPAHHIIYPSVDPFLFQPGPRDPQLRKSYQIPADVPLILGLGRLVEKKGFAYLIKAYALMLKQNQFEKVPHLVIAGGGPLLSELHALARENCPVEQVHFTDFLLPQQVMLFFRDAALFVMPSIADSKGEVETLGTTAMEAMACEIPVIASKVGGIPDVIEPEVSGILIEPNDAQAICQASLRILQDPNLAKQLGLAGRKRVEERFTWNRAVKETLAAYQTLHRDRAQRKTT